MEDLLKARENREKRLNQKNRPTAVSDSDEDNDDELNMQDLWENDGEQPWKPRKMPPAISAPKRQDPVHAQSYNPPAEFLLNQEEKQKLQAMDEEDRPYNFLPNKYSALRKVPLYKNSIWENFQRCLDLFMCPRMVRKKKHIIDDANKLIPQITDPNELRPFPNHLALEYGIVRVKQQGKKKNSKKFKDIKVHNKGKIRSIAVDISGKVIASADQAGVLCIWDIETTKLLKKYYFESEVIPCVKWNPHGELSLLSFSLQQKVYILNPSGVLKKSQIVKTDNMIKEVSKIIESTQQTQQNKKQQAKQHCEWISISEDSKQYRLQDQRLIVKLPTHAKQIVWHSKGDYFGTLANYTQSGVPIFIHSLSKASTQRPFSSGLKGGGNGVISCISFHPTKPYFLIATQRSIYIYNLQKQSIFKKFESEAKWISSIQVHPKGDNFICGTYDKKTIWFDFDLGNKPYKTFQRNQKAVRDVTFHSLSGQYPLFANASDDGSVIIFHGMVYNDAFESAKIMPLKILKGHSVTKGFGVMDIEFHPKQPWIFSCGADGIIRLWTC